MQSEKNLGSLTVIVFFVILGYVFCTSAAESSVGKNFLMAENWDTGSPPADWPSCKGASWNGWKPKDYDCDLPALGGLSSKIFYTPPRSLHIGRADGAKTSMDFSYDFTPVRKVHLRMYLYFDHSFANTNGREDQCHFILFNFTRAFTGMGVDLRRYSDQYNSWPPICNPENRHKLFFTLRSTANCGTGGHSGGEDAYGSSSASKCWNILDNLGKWILFEVMWDLPGKRGKIWVDEDLIIDREICQTNVNDISKVHLMLWDSTNTTQHDVYIDNIVISESYIGPMPQDPVTPPRAPGPVENLRFIDKH
jgi:hypothetical protein